MKKLLIILLSLVLTFTCISVAFAEDGDSILLGDTFGDNPFAVENSDDEPFDIVISDSSTLNCFFESISIAGEAATVEGNQITWETENRYEQVEMIVLDVAEGLTWKVFKGEEEVLAQASLAKTYIRGLDTGENEFTLRFYDSEENLVKTYSLNINNKGESGGDVFWGRWGQLILVLIFIIVFLLTIFIRYKRKQKQLKAKANARSKH